MKDSSRRDYRDRIADEAADWYARLQDADILAADRQAFAQWLSASAEHVQEYLALAALHADLGGVKAVHSSDELLELARSPEPQNVVPLTPLPLWERGRGEGSKRSRFRWPHILAAAASAALIAVVVLWSINNQDAATYATQRGEQKSVTLPDGSVMTLNALSNLKLDFTARSRDVRLLSGEALFDVAKNAQRPFRVLTDDAVIRAVGTRFNVYRRERSTTVTVVDGVVAVAASAKPDVMLKAGQRVRIEPQGGSVAIARVNAEAETAWRERRLIFESRPLAAVVAEFNLYNETRLAIEDPALARIEVSGNFYANDPHSFALFLEEARLAAAQDRPDGAIGLGSMTKSVVDSSK